MVFPSVLKIAKVIPIFKNKGFNGDLSNYSPISLLPIVSKIFESLLKDQVTDYLKTNDMLFQSQYGFRNNKSTTLAINNLVEVVAEAIEKGEDTYASFRLVKSVWLCVIWYSTTKT